MKRSRDEDDEAAEEMKRRKRSDSNTSLQFELSEEDKLLLQLKEEESMPWKDIAARFQSDLGKTYQIPALQMRLKRLRERMRVWTETDLRALRLAHEFWAQNKFEIIAQKVSKASAMSVIPKH
jgi:hydroxymethylpyrimidine pyrophosphatase-like HAD family hydrolase